MTLFGRDASHYDASVSFSGLSFFTHKASEGTTNPDAKYAAVMAAAKASGVPVLGSYHVLRTPGSGGAGSLAQQLAYWVANLDAKTPWWRTWPHWIMQIDAEKWPYDQVSSTTVKQFADLLVRAGLPGWKVAYASKGQFGDTLTGLATPLWNAAYGSNSGSYPGDSYSGWTPYSGQTPALLQYGSNPYDRNAYRGSQAQLLALTGGTVAHTADDVWNLLNNYFQGVADYPDGSGKKIQPVIWEVDREDEDKARVAWQATVTDALAAGGLTDAQVAALADKIVATFTASNTAFLAALAKAVNDDAAARLAS